jgi:hypothetical protein
MMRQKDLEPLTFQVFSTQAHIPNEATKPITYSNEVIKYPEITMGKFGGVPG